MQGNDYEYTISSTTTGAVLTHYLRTQAPFPRASPASPATGPVFCPKLTSRMWAKPVRILRWCIMITLLTVRIPPPAIGSLTQVSQETRIIRNNQLSQG